MKKLFILAVAFGAFTLVSCKKNWTCSCTLNGVTSEYKTGAKVNKKTAKTWCDQIGTYSGSCKLK